MLLKLLLFFFFSSLAYRVDMSNRYKQNDDGEFVHVETGEPMPTEGNYFIRPFSDGTVVLETSDTPREDPRLLIGDELEEDVGKIVAFGPSRYFEFSNEEKAISWTDPLNASWLPAPTLLQLHSDVFFIEFSVTRNSRSEQFGVGFLLDWTVGPDWGFFGYLGASSSAWSYDPSSGDIVYETESIKGGLPKFSENSGTIGMKFDLTAGKSGKAIFFIDGKQADHVIDLPNSAVVVPAACLLRKGQKVEITKFEKGVEWDVSKETETDKKDL